MRGLIEDISARLDRWGASRLEYFVGLTGVLVVALTVLAAIAPLREAHEARERKVLASLAQMATSGQRDVLRVVDAVDFALDRMGRRGLDSGKSGEPGEELPADLRDLIMGVRVIDMHHATLAQSGGVSLDAARLGFLLAHASPTVLSLVACGDGTLYAIQPLAESGRYRGAYAIAVLNGNALRAALKNVESAFGGEWILARADGGVLLKRWHADVVRTPSAANEVDAPFLHLPRSLEEHLQKSAGGEYSGGADNRFYAYRRLAEFPLVFVLAINANAARGDVPTLNAWLGTGFLVLAAILAGLTVGMMAMIRALRRAHARKAQEAVLFEATPDPVILLRQDRDGDFICERINRAASRLFEVEAPGDLPLGSLAGGEALRHVVERCLRQVTPAADAVDLAIPRAAGEAQVQISVVRLPGQGDAVPRIAVIGREITGQREAERALRERSLQLEAIFDSAMDAVLITDAHSRIVMFNKVAEGMFGYTAAEVLGQDPVLLVPGRFHGLPHERFRRLVRRRGWRSSLRTRTMLGLRKDGSEFPVDVAISRVEVDAQQILFAVILHDNTERYEAEQAIHALNDSLERRVAERTAELERAYQEMESFSYSVSHDLRAPLRAIHGYTFLLSDTEAPRLSAEGRSLLDKVMRASVRMGELIDDFLDFSRVGRAELARQRIDMGRLVSDVVSETRSSYPDARITVGLLPEANGDPRLIRQVWRNLISNALKFSAHRLAASVDIGVIKDAGRIWFYVSDNGIGFDMAYADKLFGVFQRLHASRDFEGTGIGLAIVKRVVERHRGGVRAESTPGEGATFSFWVP